MQREDVRENAVRVRKGHAAGGASIDHQVEHEIRDKKKRVQKKYTVNHERRVKAYVKAQQEKEQAYYAAGYAVVIGAVIMTLFGALRLIQVETELRKRQNQLKVYQREYDTLFQENRFVESQLNEHINIDEIYQKAVEQMQMEYPRKDQIVLYKKIEREHVIQDGNIP